MDMQTLIYEKEGPIGIVTFNRPKVLNALNGEMMSEIIDLLYQIEHDDSVRCVILTGGPKAFIAGGDIAYMSELDTVGSETFIAKAHETMNKIAHFSKPVIAAISGLALGGGCETALACDIRIAAERTIFGVPESNLALFPAGGGTQRLPRVVGIGWATQMILTGDPIDCETALKIGLVTKVVPGDKLMEEAKKIATRLAGKAPITARVTKQCLLNAISTDLTAGLLFEQKAFSYIFATEDQKEGLAAFLEKRKPSFKGK